MLSDPVVAANLNRLGIDAGLIESIFWWATVLTVVAVVLAVPTWWLARRKQRSVAGWVLAELTIPVLPLLVLWFQPAIQVAKTNSRYPPATARLPPL